MARVSKDEEIRPEPRFSIHRRSGTTILRDGPSGLLRMRFRQKPRTIWRDSRLSDLGRARRRAIAAAEGALLAVRPRLALGAGMLRAVDMLALAARMFRRVAGADMRLGRRPAALIAARRLRVVMALIGAA